MENEATPPAILARRILPIATAALAFGIFVLDLMTDVEIAVPVLYVPVVLMSGRFLRPRGVVLVSLGCATLTALGYFLAPGNPWTGSAILDRVLGLAVLATTAVLVRKNQSTEIALRERAQLLDLTHDTIFVRDPKDVVTYWNRGAEELYGWKREEATGNATHALLRTVFPEPLENITEKLRDTGRWDGELVHTKRDGGKVIVASRWSLQRDDQGRPVGTLETNNDITERKRVEESLQRQANLLEQTHDAMLVWGLPGRIIYWNRGAEQLYGFSREEAIGRLSHDLLRTEHPIPRDLFEATIERDGTWTGELTHTARDGRKIVVDSRHVLLREADGRLLVLETNRDITERKRAEDALRRSEGHLAAAQRLSLTGSFSWNIARGERYWSDETYRILGYDPCTKPKFELLLQRVHPEDVPMVRQVVDRALKDETSFDLEHRLLMPDGSIKYLHIVSHPTKDESGNFEFVGAMTDVTGAKRAAEELQQTQAELARVTRLTTMGQLAASIAHEVNQPLTGVVTNGTTCLHWLEDETFDLAKARVAAQRIVRDGQRASGVVGRIRGLMTKSAPQAVEVDLNGVITEVLALTQTELRMRRVSVDTEFAATLPPVLGDQVQLQQVILNLVINGIDAMLAVTNRPRLLLIGSRLEPGGNALIFVRDHGTGLDPEAADKIFDAFFTTKAKGIGMGLAICRSIVEAHGGRLWASAASPHGAIFQFTVPTKAAKSS